MAEKQPLRIMIADDEAVIRMGLKTMITALGHRVVGTAANGNDAHSFYDKLEHWEHLSFLKSRKTMNKLQQVRFEAEEPEKIDALIHLVNDDR